MILAALILILFLSLLVLFYTASSFFSFWRTKVPFVPTPRKDIRLIVQSLKITPRHTFFDLGSGTGKVIFLVEELTQAKTKGFELALWAYLWARLKKRLTGSRALFTHGDFFQEDWSEADFLYAYLFPHAMAQVEEKYKSNCKPGAVAIVRDFPFPKSQPSRILTTPANHKIFVYQL